MATTTAERWKRTEEVFLDALQRVGDDRVAFLDDACAGDHELRREVESLLAAHPRARRVMGEPLTTGLSGAPLLEDDDTGGMAGPYRLLRRIGAGGMGTVWLAERADEHFDKQVAVKIIKRGMDTDEILDRFRRERQVLANLEHPNIARLMDGGAMPDGRSYLVMEFVDGVPVDLYCDDRGLGVADRMRLFGEVCAAVQHAHRNLIVHRDLKPGNILVSTEGVPKLLDFGIAKILDPGTGVPDSELHKTVTELRLLTPRYASPEQVRGEPVTTASDVYSLGVVLYELLTGRQPYELTTGTRAEMEETICTREPRRPSAVADTPAAARRLRGDLDTIVMKALRKEPERRYVSVDQLADDLRRHLDGLPVLARPDTWRYRSRKFVRRHVVAVAAAAVVLVALVSASVVSTAMYFTADRARSVAVERTAEAEWQAYVANLAAADAALLDRHDNLAARRRLDASPEQHRGWEWAYLETRLERSLFTCRSGGRTQAVAFSPDATLVASGAGLGDRGYVRLWNARTGDPVQAFDRLPGWIAAIAFSPDGTLIAGAGSGRVVWVWDLATGERRTEVECDDPVGALAFSPEGTLLASAEAGTVRLRDPATGETIATLDDHEDRILAIAFNDDATRLATGDADGAVRVWNMDGRLLHRLDATSGVSVLAWEGSTLLAAGNDIVVASWDTRDGYLLHQQAGPPQATSCFDLLPAGRLAASASQTHFGGHNAILVWNIDTGEVVSTLHGHTYPGGVLDIAFSPDGSRLASGSWEGQELRVWDVSGSPPVRETRGHDAPTTSIALSPPGDLLASADEDGVVRLWDPLTAGLLAELEQGSGVTRVAFSADGTLLARGDANGVIRVRDVDTGRELDPIEDSDAAVLDLAFAPDTALLASARADGTIALHETTTGQRAATLSDHAAPVRSIAFSADGRLLASAGGHENSDDSGDTTVRVWDTRRRELVHVLEGHTLWVNAVAFLPESDRLVSAGRDNRLVLWDTATGSKLAEARNTAGGYRIDGLAVSPGGRRLAVCAASPDVFIFDVESLDHVLSLRGHERTVHGVAFSADGARLASGSADGVLRIWDTTIVRR